MTGADASPFERATTALEECLTQLEAAQEASVAVQMKKEQEAVEDLADTLAECFADGLDTPQGRFAKAVSEVSRLNKTEAKSLIARKVQEVEADDGQPLNLWVADNIEEVRVIRTTDHIQDTRYVWDFGGVTVETASGDGRRGHFGWPNFRDLVYESGGPYLDDPQPDYRDPDEWREFIVGQEEAHGVEKVSTGPRTNGVEYLKKRVRNADGFGDLEDAADMQGVFVEVNNDPPEGVEPVDTDAPEQECPEWRVDMVMLPNDWAKDAAEEYDVSVRALQNELDARGFTVEGQTSVSSQEYVGGRYDTFWTLTGDFAAPAAYQPEATKPEGQGAGSMAERDEDEAADGRDVGAIGGGDA
ncbi:hypothetical protein [Halosimplex marinum]|uniref:hypothetical protein n=1 Tax=Halosimplex marinum TaxID=3396620 RepID=UPI003F546CC2